MTLALLLSLPATNVIYTDLNGQTPQEIADFFGEGPGSWAEFSYEDYSAANYNFPSGFSVVNNLPSPNTVSFSLPAAKVTASVQAKSETSTQQQTVLAGYTPEVLAAQATLPELSRTPEIQASIAAVNDLNTALQANLTAIAAATTIDEVNNIVNPPTGLFFTGRGSGLGPQDLNVSYYTEFNSVSMTEAETELYVPGTSTVISYGSGGPGQFDSTGNCFTLGDYTIQIRETSTSQVIAEFECPLAPAGVDVSF
jgi:hypothetical protein